MTIPEIVLTCIAVKIITCQLIPGLIGYALMLGEWRSHDVSTVFPRNETVG